MGLFNKKQNGDVQQLTQRQTLENKYASSRHNILLVLLFTTINVVLLVANSNTYFLFSAFIPYMIAYMGMLLSGKFPPETYEELGMDLSEAEFFGSSFLVVALVITVVIGLLYLLCWLFSDKKRVGWLIAALVFFSLDTLVLLLGGIEADSVLDMLFHGWVIVSLSMGISAHFKLKKLPEEEPASEEPAPVELPQE